MAKERKLAAKILQKRWLRDFTAKQQVYVPEEQAKPSRIVEGFKLNGDGSYSKISSGADDKTVESDGTWELNDDDVLILSPTDASSGKREIHILKANDEQLIVEE